MTYKCCRLTNDNANLLRVYYHGESFLALGSDRKLNCRTEFLGSAGFARRSLTNRCAPNCRRRSIQQSPALYSICSCDQLFSTHRGTRMARCAGVRATRARQSKALSAYPGNGRNRCPNCDSPNTQLLTDSKTSVLVYVTQNRGPASNSNTEKWGTNFRQREVVG
jgi:hypothetical protein